MVCDDSVQVNKLNWSNLVDIDWREVKGTINEVWHLGVVRSIVGSNIAIWWRNWWIQPNLLACLGNLGLETFAGWCIFGDDFTLGNEHIEVFHGVSVSWTARGFEVVDQISVAVIISWDRGDFALLDGFQEFWCSFLEQSINLESLLKLIFESLLVFRGWLIQNL